MPSPFSSFISANNPVFPFSDLGCCLGPLLSSSDSGGPVEVMLAVNRRNARNKV